MKMNCPECKGKVKLEKSEFMCVKCGLVVDEGLFSGQRRLV
jgi:transcription initiation factor TFIIIB Brf1 subunit/transcription initiation factor TFIIB